MIKISDAEYEVMKSIWKRKQATSLEIIEDLKEHNWNFNTIRTLIKRLQNKGAIKSFEKKGKTYTYVAMIDEKKYKQELTNDLMKKLYNNSIEDFMIGCRVTVEDLKKVLKYVEEKEKNEEKENNDLNKK